jgi:hypothetical protein
VADAAALDGVLRGLEALQTSEALQAHRDTSSLQERLRPLFCPVELNLETDVAPLDDDADAVQIPAAFFVDPRLAQGAVTIDRAHYEAALESWNAEEIDRRDGDRAGDAREATSDMMAVDVGGAGHH